MNASLLTPRQVERNQTRPWPFRPKPMDGELLSSFISRLSAGFFMRPITFLNSIMGSRKNLLAQDLDNFGPDKLLQRLSNGCQIDVTTLRACTLASFQGLVNVNHNKRGRNPWVLPTTVDNNVRLRPGLQFCPLCLRDEKPYFRKIWRLGFVSTCTAHGISLRDRCPHCLEPIRPLEVVEPWQCSSCSKDIRVMTAAASTELLTWQRRSESALSLGWIRLGDEYVASTIWFAIMRQIAALLVNGPKSAAFRLSTADLYGGDDVPFPKPTERQPFEFLEVEDRCRLFTQVARLTEGWPHRFVQAASDAGLHRSHAIKDMPYVPFAYESVLRLYLDATPYCATDHEVAAAAAWLRRTKGAAYYRDLKAICGESRKSIYLHMDYQRKQARPSVWHERVKG